MNRSIVSRLSQILLWLFLFSPFLFGTSPTEPCDQVRLTGIVVTEVPSAGNPNVMVKRPLTGRLVFLTWKPAGDTAWQAVEPGMDPACEDLLGPESIATTTDRNGEFTLRVNQTLNELDMDSLRIGVILKDGTTFHDTPFTNADTLSSTPVLTSVEGGCSCITSPDKRVAGHINEYRQEVFVK